jgi:predicted transcriptional regulator
MARTVQRDGVKLDSFALERQALRGISARRLSTAGNRETAQLDVDAWLRREIDAGRLGPEIETDQIAAVAQLLLDDDRTLRRGMLAG